MSRPSDLADEAGASNLEFERDVGRWLPKQQYPLVDLRCVLPSCDETREIGLAFNLPDGTVARFRLSLYDAQRLQAALADDHRVSRIGVQSPISSASPSVEGSVVPAQSQ